MSDRPSFEKVNYSVRIAKQLERRLFVETLQRLSKAGYIISDYAYIGLGSVFYIDFVMFHRYLFINEMRCVERARIRDRMDFNLPYGFVDLNICKVSTIVPSVSTTRKHLVWLDYDTGLDSDIIGDIDGFAGRLAKDSVLIVTVDAQPRPPSPQYYRRLSRRDLDETYASYLNREFGLFVSGGVTRRQVSKEEIPKLFAEAIRSRIQSTLALSRSPLEFIQLFNYTYDDGTQMLTVGGIIGDTSDRARLAANGIFDMPFVETGSIPRVMTVPPITTREKNWFDQKAVAATRRPRYPFTMDPAFVDTYLQLYRHYPAFHDLLL